ncbi:hypothetical protein cyc_01723 [Cyclospora cayetanensis]|uniref:Uncharacterized protein n=1 Tax=Cyclospora cayetanensis TaxID=88456 RepID=A0A1D3D4V3_9EIME|nr:hypothetical protein cyc_01723 [Cyclospora cayetanensis]
MVDSGNIEDALFSIALPANESSEGEITFGGYNPRKFFAIFDQRQKRIGKKIVFYDSLEVFTLFLKVLQLVLVAAVERSWMDHSGIVSVEVISCTLLHGHRLGDGRQCEAKEDSFDTGSVVSVERTPSIQGLYLLSYLPYRS